MSDYVNPFTATAKEMRATLKAAFPGVVFSVRTRTGTVNVSWTDGPGPAKVLEVLRPFRESDVIDYLFTRRAFSYEATAQACKAWLTAHPNEPLNVDRFYPWFRHGGEIVPEGTYHVQVNALAGLILTES